MDASGVPECRPTLAACFGKRNVMGLAPSTCIDTGRELGTAVSESLPDDGAPSGESGLLAGLFKIGISLPLDFRGVGVMPSLSPSCSVFSFSSRLSLTSSSFGSGVFPRVARRFTGDSGIFFFGDPGDITGKSGGASV
jgi:hypothetical protein